MNTPIPHDDHTFVHLDCQLCLMQEVGRLVDANKQLRTQTPSADYVSAAESRIKELSAEVERLRAENAQLQALADERLRKGMEWSDEAAKLRAENAEMRASIAALSTALRAGCGNGYALEAIDKMLGKPGAGT